MFYYGREYRILIYKAGEDYENPETWDFMQLIFSDVSQDSFSAEAIKSDRSLDDTLVAVPETSGFAAFQPVKTEITINEKVKEGRETRSTVSMQKDTSEQIEISFTPTIKPRKYSLKPEVCPYYCEIRISQNNKCRS